MTPPKIYGLIGYPVKHSLSPAMHNAAFRALKINAEYKLFELEADELDPFLESLDKRNIYGLNVTVPYKERIIPLLDKLSKEALVIGAVNTIKVLDRKLEGFNTDGEGFLKHLVEDLKFNPKDKIIVIIGAGGASRAISVYLAKAKSRRISLFDIEKDKAETLVSHLKRNFPDLEIRCADSVAELEIQKSDLLINATPIGMKELESSPVDAKFLHKNLLVYDLIYNPKETKLLKTAKEKGCQTSNGLGMLLYQGAEAFEFWTGQKAPVEVMRNALQEALNK